MSLTREQVQEWKAGWLETTHAANRALGVWYERIPALCDALLSAWDDRDSWKKRAVETDGVLSHANEQLEAVTASRDSFEARAEGLEKETGDGEREDRGTGGAASAGDETMSDTDVCTCGHVRDEHGGDPKYPGSTSCAIDGCDCIAFEKGEDGDE